MDWQTVINIGLGGVLAALGWFAREIWDSLKELRKDTHQIEKDLGFMQLEEFRILYEDLMAGMM